MPIGQPAAGTSARAQDFLDNLADPDFFGQNAIETDAGVEFGGVTAGDPNQQAQTAQANAEAEAAQQQAAAQAAAAQQAQLAQQTATLPHDQVGAFGTNLAAHQQAQQAALLAQQQAAAQQAQPAGLLDWMVKDLGLAGLADAENERQAIAQLATYAQQQAAAQAQAQEQLRMYAWQLNQLQQAQRQQTAAQPTLPAAPAAAPASAAPKWLQPPDWNPAWADQLTTDQNGNLIAKPGAMPDLPQRYREYQTYQRNLLHNLATKGPDAFWEAGINERVENLLKDRLAAMEQAQAEKMQAAIDQYRSQQIGQQIRNEEGRWLFATDPMGQPVTLPNGQPQFTAEGQQFMQHLTKLMSGNPFTPEEARVQARRAVTGEGTLMEGALRETQAQLAQLQAQMNGGGGGGFDAAAQLAQQQAQAAQTAAQQQAAIAQQLQNQRFTQRQRATRQPNRGNAPAAPPQAPQRAEGETPEEYMARKMEFNLRRDGVLKGLTGA